MASMTPATSSASKVTAIVLLPSCATWSTTLAPPMAPMALARSDLPLSQSSTSTTLWVMTTFGIPFLSGSVVPITTLDSTF